MGPDPLNRRAWLRTGAALAAGWGLGGCTPVPPGTSAAHIAGGFIGANIERGHAMRDRLRQSLLQGLPLPAPAATRRAQVLIAGGGIAALAAARALRLAGVHDVAVLELEGSVGGNSRAGLVAGLPCPLGAHYLPVPGDDATEVQDLLEELGVRERRSGRWQYRDEYLCFSPQERLFRRGEWAEGLLPVQGVEPGTLAQYRRFATLVEQAMAAQRFSMPAQRSWLPASGLAPAHRALDAITFDAWLRQQQLGDPLLRWYLDYCCLDDFGAGAARVSAWAGLHYFASRHGFQAPGTSGTSADALDSVLTWPEGNGWLARQLAAPAQQAGWLHTGRSVLCIAEDRHGVQLDAFDAATGTIERWQAAHCIVALPVFIARHVVRNPPDFLATAAEALDWAPWTVANVHLRAPLADRPGAEPAWDNVFFDDVASGGLGYVDAGHQRLNARQILPTVLTCYRAPTGAHGDPGAARAALARMAWPEARDAALAPLARAHPDIYAQATRIDVMRYGHAMAIPRPGAQTVLSRIGLQHPASHRRQPWNGEHTTLLPTPGTARLHFAHGDWSGYSVFEEAFTRGHHAALRALGA